MWLQRLSHIVPVVIVLTRSTAPAEAVQEMREELARKGLENMAVVDVMAQPKQMQDRVRAWALNAR